MIRKLNIFTLFLCCSLMLHAQTWDTLWPRINGYVCTFNPANNLLYIGGGIAAAGNINLNGIAAWDGNKIDSVNTHLGLYATVYSIYSYNNYLYAGGYGVPLKKFDGTTWSSINTGITNYYSPGIDAMTLYKNKLYFGGRFYGTNNIHSIACWNDTNCTNLNGGAYGNYGMVYALTVYNNELIAGGDFAYAGGVYAFNIAAWDGSNWHALDTGVDDKVCALTVDTINNFLYVAGSFYTAGGYNGVSSEVIARWDGYRWDSIDHNNFFFTQANSLTMYHNNLFMGSCGGTQTNSFCIVKWTGKKWVPLYNGPDNAVLALGVYKDELYAGGYFTKVGQDSVLGIARYYEPPDTTCDYLQPLIEPRNTVSYTTDSTTVNFYNNIIHASSWHWNFGDGATDTVQMPTHTYINPGIYNVSVIVKYQHCVDTAYTTVYAYPCSMLQASIYPANDTLFLSSSGKVTFTSNIPNANSYYWDFGDGTTSNAGNPTHTYTKDTVYSIMLIITKGKCADTSYTKITVINNIGIKENSKESDYLGQNIPNPFNQTTTIPYNLPYGSSGIINITDATGKQIKEYNLLQGKNNLVVSLNGITSGTYYYSIIINGIKKETKSMIMQ